jgi:UDP-N-acetylmuramoyl-L-alanyl-D-glutamate--2,6-diaminopimelate ligase
MAAISLTQGIPLSSLLQGFSPLSPTEDLEVTGLAIDSRAVQAGDLFVAYREGAKFIDNAIRAGACAIVAEMNSLSDLVRSKIPVFYVTDLNSKVGTIASRFYGEPSKTMTITGVTGTNGKTSISYLLAQALSFDKHDCGFIGTLGYGTVNDLNDGLTTTPDPVTLQHLLADMRDQGLSQVVMEVSSHGLDQHRIAGVDVDLGIFSNLSRDHLDYHGNIENYANIKRHFFTDYSISKAVINIDDELGQTIVDELEQDIYAVAYILVDDLESISESGVPLVAGKINNDRLNGMVLDLKTPWGTGLLETNLLGKFNAYNLLACLTALCLLDIPFAEAVRRLSLCRTVPGRMECFGGDTQPLIFVDYAHTPDALAQALAALKSQCQGKLYCVFGCGGDRDKGKRALMGKTAQQYADVIFLTNDNPRNEDPDVIIQAILSGIENKDPINIEIDRKAAIKSAINVAEKNDIVLIAGKGHERYQDIKGVRHEFSDQAVVSKLLEHAK